MKTILTVALLCVSSLAAFAKPLKVFILAGQSNMEGHAAVSTFDYIGKDPLTAPFLKEMRNPAGTASVCNKDTQITVVGKKEQLPFVLKKVDVAEFAEHKAALPA